MTKERILTNGLVRLLKIFFITDEINVLHKETE